MAIATGTALLLGAGAAAAGQVGGAALASRASGRATEAGLEANREALDYQREQNARAEAAYQEQWQAWNASRNALLQRYGIDIGTPEASPGAPAAGPGAVPRPAGGVGPEPTGRIGPGAPTGRPTPGPIRGQGLTVGDLATQPVGRPELGGWRDWSRMGLGRRARA